MSFSKEKKIELTQNKNSINKKTREIIVSNLTLQDESIILYDNYDKINSLHIYANLQKN